MAHRKRIGKIGTLQHIDGRSIGGVISHAVNGLFGMKRAVDPNYTKEQASVEEMLSSKKFRDENSLITNLWCIVVQGLMTGGEMVPSSPCTFKNEK